MTGPTIEKLRRDHPVDGFDCGIEPLNRFLVKLAFVSQLSEISQVYVALNAGVVVGYYALTVGEAVHNAVPVRVAKGLPQHPVPLMVLARLAVDRGWQGRRLGGGLLRDAMQRTAQAADIAGIRALIVHAKDASAAAFYARFGFEPSPSDSRHLFMLMKDIRAAIRKASKVGI